MKGFPGEKGSRGLSFPGQVRMCMMFAYNHSNVSHYSKVLLAQLVDKVLLVHKEDKEDMGTGVDQARRYTHWFEL